MQMWWLLIQFLAQFILKQFPFFIIQEILRKVSKLCIYIYACLVSFGAESFVFQVAIKKFKDQDI